MTNRSLRSKRRNNRCRFASAWWQRSALVPFVCVRVITFDGGDCDLCAVEIDFLRLITAYNVQSTVGRRNRRIKSAHTHGSNGGPFVLKYHNGFVDELKLYYYEHLLSWIRKSILNVNDRQNKLYLLEWVSFDWCQNFLIFTSAANNIHISIENRDSHLWARCDHRGQTIPFSGHRIVAHHILTVSTIMGTTTHDVN